jgi:hypothetical protein
VREDPSTHDATCADFSHSLGHECIACRVIREDGPEAPKNPLVRLMGRAQGDVVAPPTRTKRALRNETRKRIGRGRLLRALIHNVKTSVADLAAVTESGTTVPRMGSR